MSKKELLSDRPDSDNPEWTDKEARNATQFRNLPAPLQAKLARGKRGPQKAPRKIQTAISYDVEVLQHFNDQGDGWKTRMKEALNKDTQPDEIHDGIECVSWGRIRWSRLA